MLYETLIPYDKTPFKPNPNRKPLTPRKCKFGDRVLGKRGERSHIGLLVEAYYTINDNMELYLNPAYVILCDDGKRRSYQSIERV